jgi:hypothetical protein
VAVNVIPIRILKVAITSSLSNLAILRFSCEINIVVFGALPAG